MKDINAMFSGFSNRIITASGYPGILQVSGADDTIDHKLKFFAPDQNIASWINNGSSSRDAFLQQITIESNNDGVVIVSGRSGVPITQMQSKDSTGSRANNYFSFDGWYEWNNFDFVRVSTQ